MKLYRYAGCVVEVHQTDRAKTVGGITLDTGRKRKRTTVRLRAGNVGVPLAKASEDDFAAARQHGGAFAKTLAPLPAKHRPKPKEPKPA